MPMVLPTLAPRITPSLPGEGVWLNALPAVPGQPVIVAKTFWRPDPSRPYAIVALLQFDPHLTRLHLVAGSKQPGGPLGNNGPGLIPRADQRAGILLAAFNGGFKYADGAYGMMANHRIYVPPVRGAGTVAITRSGRVLIGSWGVDPSLSGANRNLVAWRQNGPLLIAQGRITGLAQDASAWGRTLNGVFTWRSGIGITRRGTLLYAAGNAVTPWTLGEALKHAGAVTAIQTDINPYWVRAFVYSARSTGHPIAKRLRPSMHGTGLEYLRGYSRDFFYVTKHQG